MIYLKVRWKYVTVAKAEQIWKWQLFSLKTSFDHFYWKWFSFCELNQVWQQLLSSELEINHMIQKLKLTTWTDVDHQYILTHINLEPWLNIENLKISIEGKFVLLEIDSISTNFTHYDFYLPILSRGIFMYKKCLHYHDVVKNKNAPPWRISSCCTEQCDSVDWSLW